MPWFSSPWASPAATSPSSSGPVITCWQRGHVTCIAILMLLRGACEVVDGDVPDHGRTHDHAGVAQQVIFGQADVVEDDRHRGFVRRTGWGSMKPRVFFDKCKCIAVMGGLRTEGLLERSADDGTLLDEDRLGRRACRDDEHRAQRKGAERE